MANYDSFTGFTFNGKHSSDFHIIRVSNGSRYENELVPAPKDTTIDVPFGDGMYLFGSKYQQRTFNIEFAYDSVEEKDIRAITQWLSEKKPCDLIFDETPYKKYKAKISGAPKMSWICFDAVRTVEGVEENYRVYKGEGNVQFVCYYPWAESVYKALNDYSSLLPQYANKWEWADASGMLPSLSGYDTCNSSGKINLYNPGDIPTNYRLFVALPHKLGQVLEQPLGDIKVQLLDNYDNVLKSITIQNPNESQTSENFYKKFLIDTKQHLILQVNTDDTNIDHVTSNVMNYLITDGDFFDIPVCEDYYLQLINVAYSTATGNENISSIEYNYKYY